MDNRVDRREDKFRLDKSVNLGNLITIAIVIFSMLQMYGGIVAKMTAMESKVDMMWQQFSITLRQK